MNTNELNEVRQIRKKLGLTQEQLAKAIGVDTKTVQNWEYGRPIPKSKHEILRNLAENGVSPAPIKPQTYYGEPLQSEDCKTVSLPLIPIDALAGKPNEDNFGVTLAECEQYTVPEFSAKGAQYLLRVSGTSMLPKYNNGDLLACRKIDEITFFQWGKVYVIDTRQGILVKKLFPDKDNPQNILCVSENKDDFPPFTLPMDEIRSISIVVGVIGVE